MKYSIWWRIASAGCLFLFWQSPHFAFAQEVVPKYVEVLRSLRTNWSGTHAEFEIDNVGGKVVTSPRVNRVWFDQGGVIARSFKRYTRMRGEDYVANEKWTYTNGGTVFGKNSYIFLDDNRIDSNYFASVSISEHSEEHFSVYSPLVGFLGWDRPTQRYWYEILEDPDTVSVVRSEGENRVVVADHPAYGHFEFTFDVDDRDRIQLDSVQREFSNPELAQEVMPEGFFECQYRVQINEHRQFQGRSLVSALEMESKQINFYRGQRSPSQWATKQRLVSVEELQQRLTKRIDIPDLEIEDGTPIRVRNDEGVPYEFRDGFLVRVVAADAIVENEDARFRRPPGAGTVWYVGFGILLLAAGAWFFYRRGR